MRPPPCPPSRRYRRGRWPPTANARPRRAPRSCGGRTSQLPLEGGDVPLPEPPLSALLEGGQDALARELVDRVGTAVEDLGNLFAVEQGIFCIEHGAARLDPGHRFGSRQMPARQETAICRALSDSWLLSAATARRTSSTSSSRRSWPCQRVTRGVKTTSSRSPVRTGTEPSPNPIAETLRPS